MTVTLKNCSKLGKTYGTPLFILDEQKLEQNYARFYRSFSKRFPKVAVAYSYKTNYLPAICEKLRACGAWAEIIPGFEYHLACKLGVPPEKTIVNGPYKPEKELKQVLAAGCRVNIDSFEELGLVLRLANNSKHLGVGLRLSIPSDKIGLNRFGFAWKDAIKAAKLLRKSEKVHLDGVHFHLGNSIAEPRAYSAAVETACRFIDLASDPSQPVRYIDVGGGFATSGSKRYGANSEWKAPTLDAYSNAITKPLEDYRKEITLIIEPGRILVDDAVSLLSEVVSVKRASGLDLVNANAGLNLLPWAYYRKLDLEFPHRCTRQGAVFGPICSPSDVIYRGMIPRLINGEFILVRNAGAYSISSSTQFIRPRPAVVSISGKRTKLVRRAEDAKSIFSQDLF